MFQFPSNPNRVRFSLLLSGVRKKRLHTLIKDLHIDFDVKRSNEQAKGYNISEHMPKFFHELWNAY